jgi:hypothetical protein
MADAEVAKYNKAVEKLCVDCAGEVSRLLLDCKRTIKARVDKLASDITKVPVPDMPPAALAKVTEQVNAILVREGSAIARVTILQVLLRADSSAKKLTVTAAGVSGPLALI